MVNYGISDPAYNEKRKIKKTANCIGGAFLIGWGATFLLSFVTTFVSIISSLFSFDFIDVLNSDIYMWIMQIVFSAFVFTVPFVIMTIPMNTRVSAVCEFSKPKKGYTLPLVLIGCGVLMISNILGSAVTSIFNGIGFSDSQSALSSDPQNGWIYPVLSLLGGAALPALVEEFALRGIVLGSFRKFGNGFAIIASAAMFGLMHATFSQIPFAFVLGLCFGYITVKTESIWPAMLLHFINNAFSFSLDSVSGYLSQNTYNIVQAFYFIVMLLATFLGIVLLKGRDLSLKNDDNTSVFTTGQKLRAAAATPCMIISFIYIGMEMLLIQLVA